jgi:Transmembrane secretion effector
VDGERQRMGRRPGRPLATLLAAGAVSNLGDGVTLAAAPLLAASITRDPRAIAAVGVAWSLPWLLFALVSGAVADRADRRRLMVGADLVRVGSLAALTAAVLGGRASIPALVTLFFVNATAETVFDTASQSTLPMVVDREDLPRANGWLQTVEFAANGLLGPALGGVLFAAAAAAPFAVDAASFGLSALLLAQDVLGLTPAATACSWPAWPWGACSAARWPPGCTAASATRAAWSARSCS